jgi:hypothetical protein
MSDWKSIVGAVAPTIAAALGGPLAGVAVSALSSQLLGKKDGTPDEIGAAVLAGGPDALLAIKQSEQAFASRMKELDIDIERLHQTDRSSAREREAKTGDTLTPRLLAGLVTLGFFGALAWLLVYGKPETGGDALLVMLGALGGAWASVISYYFGSSAGSAAKTQLLGKQ